MKKFGLLIGLIGCSFYASEPYLVFLHIPNTAPEGNFRLYSSFSGNIPFFDDTISSYDYSLMGNLESLFGIRYGMDEYSDVGVSVNFFPISLAIDYKCNSLFGKDNIVFNGGITYGSGGKIIVYPGSFNYLYPFFSIFYKQNLFYAGTKLSVINYYERYIDYSENSKTIRNNTIFPFLNMVLGLDFQRKSKDDNMSFIFWPYYINFLNFDEILLQLDFLIPFPNKKMKLFRKGNGYSFSFTLGFVYKIEE